MSFYEEDESSNGSIDPKSELCPVCGGKDFHKQDGVMTCSSCFTQSQTQNIDEVVDDDDFGLVTGGNVRKAKKLKKGSRKKPLSYFDRRKPLPTLENCILAAQDLLKKMARQAGILAGVQEKDMLLEVKSLWFGYMKGWTVGAEIYSSMMEGKQNLPRFSMRDSFLGRARSMRLISFLQKKLKKRMINHSINPQLNDMKTDLDTTKTNTDSKKEDSFPSSSSDFETSSISSESDKSELDSDLEIKQRKKVNVSSLSRFHKMATPSVRNALNQTAPSLNKEIITRFEAALRAPPSMELFVAIIHRALFNLRAGIAATHLRRWIINESIPYRAAFYVLSTKSQKGVEAIPQFFQPMAIPTVPTIEHHSELVWIASGRDPITKSSQKERERLAIYHHAKMIDNAPLMAARFVKDLYFSKRVLDIVYSLMGIESFGQQDSPFSKQIAPQNNSKKEEEKGIRQSQLVNDDNADKAINSTLHNSSHPSSDWLPPGLKLARIKNMTNPAQILGLIIVACKMCPDWEFWVYKHPSIIHEEKAAEICASKSTNQSEENKPRLEKVTKKTHTYVPNRESNLQHLTNGESLKNFAEFTANVSYARHESAPTYENIVNWMSSEQKNRHSNMNGNIQFSSSVKVLPNPIIARPPPPALRGQNTEIFNQEILNLTKDSRYPNTDKMNEIPFYKVEHSFRNFRWSAIVRESRLPINAAYGLLLEYVCDKFYISPTVMNRIVEKLEYEIGLVGSCLFSPPIDSYGFIAKRNVTRLGVTKKSYFNYFEHSMLNEIYEHHIERHRNRIVTKKKSNECTRNTSSNSQKKLRLEENSVSEKQPKTTTLQSEAQDSNKTMERKRTEEKRKRTSRVSLVHKSKKRTLEKASQHKPATNSFDDHTIDAVIL